MDSNEVCAICGCFVHRTAGTYGTLTVEGRSHATRHHFVAERFFGRSSNRPGQREGVFRLCPWDHERKTGVFCYECHEELLHNPVLLPHDVDRFAQLVKLRRLSERNKGAKRHRIAGRVRLLHEVIDRGLDALLEEAGRKRQASDELGMTDR
jgi:hypothetical protein